MEEIIIDAEERVVGRLASRAAKEALKGNSIFVVNVEKAIISGNPKATEKFFFEKVERGDPYHGPFYPKTPEGIMKRVIRGMLPYKKPLGKKALKRVKVYKGIPEEFKDRELKDLGADKKLRCKYMTLENVCEKIRGTK